MKSIRLLAERFLENGSESARNAFKNEGDREKSSFLKISANKVKFDLSPKPVGTKKKY